jgi:hypothetical protein
VFLQWSVGNKLYNINRSLLTTAGRVETSSPTCWVRQRHGPPTEARQHLRVPASTLFVEDGSYLRGEARARRLCAVPARWLQRAHDGARERGRALPERAERLHVTSYSGYDPELSEYSLTNLHQASTSAPIRKPRQITVGFSSAF